MDEIEIFWFVIFIAAMSVMVLAGGRSKNKKNKKK